MNQTLLRWILFIGLFCGLETASLNGVSQEQSDEVKRESLQKEMTNLRSAILDLTNDFGKQYPNGAQFLQQLASLEDTVRNTAPDALEQTIVEFNDLRHAALIANPLVCDQPILFTVRHQYRPDHHSTATMFQNGEINTRSFTGGGALKTIHFGENGGIRTLLEVPDGAARDPEISYEGDQVLFSMRRNINDDYHIYSLDLDHLNLTQLTFGEQLSDIDPVYLPDDSIVFVSTREPKYCQCNRHIMGNLFKMDREGGHIRQIGRNSLFEGHPSLMPDGRILYDRWEYVDKHFGPAFGLWTVNPDGTNHAVYYGNNAWAPGAIVDARIIPNTDLTIATFSSCHDRPWGAIVILDRRKGLDGVEPIERSWPPDIKKYITNQKDYGNGSSRNHPAGGQIDNFKQLSIKYEDPYPLSEKYFLCSRMVEGETMGIYLLDVFGNEILLHTEDPGCYDPMPIIPSPRPPVLPSHTDYAKKEGFFYVTDVYTGTGMESVKRGAVKSLRVVEAPVKKFWTQTNWNLDATQAPAMNFNCTNNKRILGTVPIEKDGSAYFSVPADKFVFFQLLDENGMMIQSMRSGTIALPGETLGCVGCHENRLTTITPKAPPLATQRPPSTLNSWYGFPRDFNYLTEVQPVFDKHCVQCHDYGKRAGLRLNLAGDLGLVFNTSYLELRTKSALRWFPDPTGAKKLLVKAVDDGPAEWLPAYSWGSHRSRLVDVIQRRHHGVKLDRESMDRIVTWIDMNAPYYGSYASVYPDNVFGRSPLNNWQIDTLRKLTGINVGDISTELQGSQISFTRPECSPCLTDLKEKNPTAYQEALAIILEGQKMLAQKPRMDMPGAQLLECDKEKEEKYAMQMEREEKVRKNLQKSDSTIN